MNKLLSFGVAVVISFSAVPAFASVDCTVNPSSCQGGGNPGLISMPWGLTGDQTPVVASGSSFNDGYGHMLTCPWWFPAGCYDITKTAYYRTAVLGLK